MVIQPSLVCVRFYDPTTGQFLTRDPLEALTRSAYGYAYDNPINLTDPTGLCSCGSEGKGGGSLWDFAVAHRGQIANIATGVTCVVQPEFCLGVATFGAVVNMQQHWHEGPGSVAWEGAKAYAFAIPGLAEYGEEASAEEALRNLADLGASSEGWAAPAWFTYGTGAFYEGAVATPDFIEMGRSWSERSSCQCCEPTDRGRRSSCTAS